MEDAIARIARLASGLPCIEIATSYGTPALKCTGKLLIRIRDRETAVLPCDFGEKDLLLESAPDIYFQTDHYKGWPSLLVRLGAVSDEELRQRLTAAFRLKAPRRLVAEWERAQVG